MYKNLIIIGIISIFLFGTASSASNSKTINISGTWYYSAIQFTYEIKQVGNSFYWDVISPIHEHGVGTINNNSVFAKWKGDNG
jgi:hypothetical protein